jgi:hypothetical protein
VTRILFTVALLLSLLGGASTALGNDKLKSFGALETLSPETAKTKLTAWLKEVGKSDPATQKQLQAIWEAKDRSILDRMGDSLALGDPVAAKLMNEARDTFGPAPIIVPDVFKNEKQPVFYRANLALIYARALTNRRVYEEALDTLALFSTEQVADPAAYLFHRAVCEHALLRKPEATKSIHRLLDEASSLAPERYKTVATLMLLDMHTWKDKDLGDIARKMENIERRLEIARGGPETQRQQREVLNRLDELIKKLENANKSKKKPGEGDPKPGDPKPGDGQGEQCPDGGKPGDGSQPGPPKGINPPTAPASDTQLPPGEGGTGVVDQVAFKKLVADWGRMSPRQRERAREELTQGMSARHREAIENYFRNLTNPSLKK